MSSTKHFIYLGLLTSIALVIYTVEAQIPTPFPVPGMKLGFANMISLATLILDGPLSALLVLILRIILGSLFTGQIVSLSFSLCGGLLSLGIMCLLYILFKSQISLWIISLCGGICHNLGQLLVAFFIVRQTSIFYYFLPLFMAGLFTGAFNGLCVQYFTHHLKALDQGHCFFHQKRR